MALPRSLANFSFFSVYDRAIRRWISALVNPVDKNIRIVMASPQRAFAQLDELQRRSASTGEGQEFNENLGKMPMPFVSVQRGSIEPRSGRMYPDKLHFRNFRPSTPSGRYSISGRAPVPVFLEYQIDIWTKTQSSMSSLVDRILNAFDPYLAYGTVKVGEGWAPYPMCLRLGSLSETSDLEGGDSEDRIIRYSLSVRVEAWKFFDFKEELVAQEVIMHDNAEDAIPGLEYVSKRIARNLFLQNERGLWYEVSCDEKGNIFFWPASPERLPQKPEKENVPSKSTYFALTMPLVLQAEDKFFEFFYDHKVGRLRSRYVGIQEEDVEENFVLHKKQRLLIPESAGSIVYGELKITDRGYANLKMKPLSAPQSTS